MTVYLSNVSAPRIAKRPTEMEAGKDDEVGFYILILFLFYIL